AVAMEQLAKALDSLVEMHAYVTGVKSDAGRTLRISGMSLDDAMREQATARLGAQADSTLEQVGREALEAEKPSEAITPAEAKRRGREKLASEVLDAKGPDALPEAVKANEVFQNPIIREYELWNKRAKRWQKELAESETPDIDQQMIVEGTGKADPTNQRQKDKHAQAIHVEGPKPAASWAEVAAGHERAAKRAEKAKNAEAVQANREAAKKAREAERLMKR